MLISHDREKLIQAINFFARRTRKCGKTKLFKLLFFLDFEHFKRTGRSVTGLEYNAWPKGPVPVALFEEMKAPSADMAAVVGFEEKPTRADRTMTLIVAKAPFDDQHFTRRELSLMEKLANDFRDTDAADMVEATHLENQPWHKVYVEQDRKQEPIPYELAVRPDEIEAVMQVARDREHTLGLLR